MPSSFNLSGSARKGDVKADAISQKQNNSSSELKRAKCGCDLSYVPVRSSRIDTISQYDVQQYRDLGSYSRRHQNPHVTDNEFQSVIDPRNVEMNISNLNSQCLDNSLYSAEKIDLDASTHRGESLAGISGRDKGDVDNDVYHNDICSTGSYYNHSTEDEFQIPNQYIDGSNYWKCKMNAYHSKSNAMIRHDDSVIKDAKIKTIGVVDYTSSTRNRNCMSAPIGAMSCTMIQVSPGEYMRLRGSQETWKAIQEDFYLPGSCISCHQMLFCIADACFVLCPKCDVVSPSQQGKILLTDGYNGGVGLGFTMDELREWQNEIITARNRT